MILYLFGGSSTDTNREKQQALIFQQLEQLRPKQLLDVWFAITNKNEAQRKYLEFKKKVELRFPDCQVLDAGDQLEVKKATSPLIFVAGGDSNAALIKAIENNHPLKRLILETDVYFGASAGAMIVGEKVREEDGQPFLRGLNILKSTVIEPHYTEWRRHDKLRQEMKDWHCRYGVGIDEACALVVNPSEFPKNYQTLGEGLAEVVETK